MKIMMRTLTLSLVLLNARPVWAKSSGSTAFDFLMLDASGRAVAMGGAFTALAEGAPALHYNPAGLALAQGSEAALTRNISVQGISQEYAAVSFAKGWGFEINRLDLGDIPRTTAADPDGTSGSASFNDLSIGVGGGMTPRPGLSLGAGFKVLRESIDGDKARGYAFDTGILYDIPKVPGLRLGAALLNLGPAVRFDNAKESLPIIARTGALYAFHPWGQESRLTLDLMRKNKQELLWAAGLETMVKGMSPVRLGYNRRQDAGSGFTMGLGWRYRTMQLDYAFEMEGALGDSHRWSLTWRWGGTAKPADGTSSACLKKNTRHAKEAERPSSADHLSLADVVKQIRS